MNWYYSRDNQPTGPVEDAELVRLAQTGVVTGATLVWHGGMTDWQPFDNVRTALAVAASNAAAPGQTACSQCGRVFPADEVVRVGAYDVCAGCKPALIQKLREGAAVSQPHAGLAIFAGFWIRLGAAFLDSVILIPAFVVIYGVAIFLFRSHLSDLTHPQDTSTLLAIQGIEILFALCLVALQGLYSAFMVSRYGGTPGKRICELRIVRSNGDRLTFGRALGRFCAKTLPRAVPLLGLIYMVVDPLFICFDEERRALHDQIAGTRVIHQK